MDADKIVQDLHRRFSEPLPEFYKRRIVFWYDEEREFEDQLEDIRLDNVKLVRLTGSNTFAVKKLLCEDDQISNYLVYDPRTFTHDDDNWLINVQLYSEEFRADLNSIWISEMGLESNPAIRSQVKRYRKFFNSKERREAVKKLGVNIATAAQLHQAVMAVIGGCSGIQPAKIFRAVLSAGLDMDNNSVYKGFKNYGADKAFWMLASKLTGYTDAEDPRLSRLAAHTLLTAATRTIHEDYLAGLNPYYSIPHQAWCYDFISDWLHSEDNRVLYDIARTVEHALRLPQRFATLNMDDLVNTECFPCVNESILTALMKEISDEIVQAERIKATVQKRRAMVWYDKVSCYYDGLLQVANMQSFFAEHSAGFHTVEPYKIWREYTTDYYRMDTWYRQYHRCFQQSLMESNPLLDDLFKHVTEKVEGLYSYWYLGQLAGNWTNAVADNMEEHGHALEVPRQEEFYNTKVRTNSNRLFVIISDGMRYEVAASLREQLQRDMQCQVTLGSCQSVFPSETRFGMAALLPHKKLSVTRRGSGELAVLADGQYTDVGYRDKVLKGANQNSIALTYDTIIGMKRAERAALVKGMDVVYIYHDKIDETGHKSETEVFQACADAITEVKNMIRIIVNEFGGTNVIVTADHGFLYTYDPLKADSKVDKSTPTEQDVEVDRRYLITEKGTEAEYLLPVRFLGGDTEYSAWTPRENIRITKKGGGLNYVHGGISLQEMVVPVLEFQYLRNSSKTYQRNRESIDTKPVTISILSAGRRISNMIFSLSFYQKEAVGGNREAATYLLYFTDDNGQKVSDTCKIIADKTTENAQERTYRCNFNLRSQKYSGKETYYLVIADESGLQAPVKEPFQIDIAFAVDGFGF